jgi:hypothetical protein
MPTTQQVWEAFHLNWIDELTFWTISRAVSVVNSHRVEMMPAREVRSVCVLCCPAPSLQAKAIEKGRVLCSW